MRNSLKTPLTQAQMLEKMQQHLDKSVLKKGYTDKDFEQILKAHNRKAD